MNRPSWNEYFKTLVLHTTTRSPCERLKVGCILVKDNRIIRPSEDYIGPDGSVWVDMSDR